MARPSRPFWVKRVYARRRHRTWMRSMALATVGWGLWFGYALLGRWAPSIQPPMEIVTVFGVACGLPGLLLALLTMRGRRSWLLFVLVPLFANACLLAAPFLVDDVLAPR